MNLRYFGQTDQMWKPVYITQDVLWLVNNAKECPKCMAFIEKRGGCNWMKCAHCKYEFCWLCFKAIKHGDIDAAGGSHRCNKV